MSPQFRFQIGVHSVQVATLLSANRLNVQLCDLCPKDTAGNSVDLSLSYKFAFHVPENRCDRSLRNLPSRVSSSKWRCFNPIF